MLRSETSHLILISDELHVLSIDHAADRLRPTDHIIIFTFSLSYKLSVD